jgi:urease accessory protein
MHRPFYSSVSWLSLHSLYGACVTAAEASLPALPPSALKVPGAGQWQARLELDLARRRDATRLVGCSHEGPLYVQKPFYPEGPDCAHIYLLHPPGGIVSGDTLSVDVRLGEGAAALLTTPGAARAYRARGDGAMQRQITRIEVSAGASIEWMPQETIIYNGANVEVETEIDLADGAQCIAWEVMCLGLPARDELFVGGSFQQRYKVMQAGVPVFIDGFGLDAANLRAMTGPGGLGDRSVTGFILAGPFSVGAAAMQVDTLRQATASREIAGLNSLTCLGRYVVGRYLGHSAEHARQLFESWWHILRPSLLGSEACPPRIWLT